MESGVASTLTGADVEALRDIVFRCFTQKSWEELANHSCLRKDPPTESTRKIHATDVLYAGIDLTLSNVFVSTARSLAHPGTSWQEKATIDSWTGAFIGHAADELWGHIVKYSKWDNLYSRFCEIVQSSAMGKSKLVDELSKTHFVIPINLRGKGTAGYPPPDEEVREYLTANSSADELYARHSAFLTALFIHTTATLEQEEYKDAIEAQDTTRIASLFRAHMAEGMSTKSHGDFRKAIYHTVITEAEKKFDQIMVSFASTPGDQSSERNYGTASATAAYEQAQAFQRLVAVLRKSGHRESPRLPLVILAFDEAHTLSVPQTDRFSQWTSFAELQSALRSIERKPVFSLFLSRTASGKTSKLTPSQDVDNANRIITGELRSIPIYTLTGYDQLAPTLDLSNPKTLDEVVADSWICHYGRPLFGSRYDHGADPIKAGIVEFAACKLLNAKNHIPSEFDGPQQLACLSQRLPLEFESTTQRSREQEKKQVEVHLRVCLRIDAGVESMVTTSPSEPLLAEAASLAMRRPKFDAPNALKSVLDGFPINKGVRGETLILLLLTLARDAVVQYQPAYRAFTVIELITALFHQNMTARELDSTESLPLDDIFFVHFNHFIKAHQPSIINRRFLAALLHRGAAVLCANGQEGVDIVIPFVHGPTSTPIRKERLGAILCQVKNDQKYDANPQMHLFQAMDPYNIGFFDEADEPIPIIRIVFALAAKTPSLTIIPSKGEEGKFIAYDIWCAGISPLIFRPIDPSQGHVWEALLQASYGWQSVYRDEDGRLVERRMSLNPGIAEDDGHWSNWVQGT
ncbi:hypothetical protein JAAARDRAFT_154830 [Jaapia argillacea MUCL 33604]|uniref:Uncharacterized protein n=1 Tax=Jaapia argillacea MUCL 33604 TaxID=933084 RepID=A0A067PX05_9AGAM|nr:hypothetical protein JAAARDRAFT_154830 [Jaapia argillacea MUCL 33604]